MDIEGVVSKILQQTNGSSPRGNWVRQDFIIEQTSDFDKKLCVSVWGDKVNELAKLSIGDKVSVGVNVESREYNGKWYTDIRAWRITPAAISSAPSDYAPPLENMTAPMESSEDNLPF